MKGGEIIFMKNLAKKVAVAVSTGALLAQSLIVPAFATITVEVSGNGVNSDNTTTVTQTTTTSVVQSNTANVSNDIHAVAESGENTANGNTGGEVKIDAGAATAAVTVSNTLNSNEAEVACGGCAGDVNVKVANNGKDSDNDVNLGVSNTSYVNQNNTANVNNDVDVHADSGDNEAEDNTGGDVSITTKLAKATADVSTEANINVAKVGADQSAGALDILVTGNGVHSDNDVVLGITNTTTVLQNNLANVFNDVEAVAESGENEVEGTTNGEASIETGAAIAGAIVDTSANFNWADVEGCCEMDGSVKVVGNGVNSDNDVKLTLGSHIFPDQKNVFDPGKENHHHKGGVEVYAGTGENEMEGSTGSVYGDPSIETGTASTTVEVDTTGNSNVFTTDDVLPSPLPEFDMPDLGSNMNWFVYLLYGFMHS